MTLPGSPLRIYNEAFKSFPKQSAKAQAINKFQ